MTLLHRRLTFCCAVLLIASAAFARSAQSQQADVIRGRVIDGDSVALENVLVTVTSVTGNVSRTARTDRGGRFTVTFPGGDGDYMVAYASLGFAARQFQVKRNADEDILVADAKLTRIGAILDPVQVTAQREQVRRGDIPADVGGTDRPLSNAVVPADLMGDLAAMAASLPGVQSVPGADGGADGYSVLGLGADQNSTTLDGMQFGGSNLPRDASIGSSLVTSPYDVSRGGFSGAQMTLRTRSGSNFVTRGMSANVDA
ncbi:MAG: TonB-dependent receptor, partial [Gemmatimonadota bacterium]|nr:TonB-dependent receptor [Gemmatimonadota bacterium]